MELILAFGFLPFGKVWVSVYHFHDTSSSAQCVLFGRCVTVVARSVAELCHLRGRGEHERGFGFRVY